MSLSKSTRQRVSSLEQVKRDAAELTRKRLSESQNILPKPAPKPQAPQSN